MKFPEGADVQARIENLGPQIQRFGLEYDTVAKRKRDLGSALENLYRLYTRVKPDFIRVDADEVTYPCHVILRFEIEKPLMLGKLEVRDIPVADGLALAAAATGHLLHPFLRTPSTRD